MKCPLVCHLLPALALAIQAVGQNTNLKRDEEIVFYPSVAQRVSVETNVWHTTIRGTVFEPERRSLLTGAFRNAIELGTEELSAEEDAIFTRRARLFLVDHERSKHVHVHLGPNTFLLGTSGADGRFTGKIAYAGDFTNVIAVLAESDHRTFTGLIFPVEEEGLSVISDIDDTIKITEVHSKSATLRNTFLREFQAVPGMAGFYRDLAESNNAAFHYISASPWQLYQPLADFVASNGFPAGTFELKPFRWKDRSFFSLFADPEVYKSHVIEPLLRQFPRRKFILIGDSGERDPEIYGALAQKYPEQISRIYIRNVTNESTDAARYQEAFHGVPAGKWRIFLTPGEIRENAN